jgi:hypothetical protein
MDEEELNPNPEEQDLNLDEEDDFEFEEDDNELSDDEKEKIALEIHNKKTGKSFKSWDDVAKSVKEADKAFAQHPPKKKVENVTPPVAQPVEKPEGKPQTLDADLAEEVMLMRFPELASATDTRKELKELAALKGVSELSLYKTTTYFQNKAKEESESKKEMEGNKERIGSPSAPDGGVPKTKVTKEDVKIAEKFFGGDIARYMKSKAK